MYINTEEDLQVLKDEIIRTCYLSENQEELVITCKTTIFIFKAEGDCCSHSWIEHIDNIPSNSHVLEIIEKDVMIKKQEEDSDSEIKQYFYEIKTDKGSFTIEMRNSSNGYYGGCIRLSQTIRLLKS